MDAAGTSEEPFDFTRHRLEATHEYQKVRPLYKRYAWAINAILRQSLNNAGIKIASIEDRAKTIDSFGEKASEPSSTKPNVPKYTEPLKQITDLAGVRIITFFPRTIQDVDRIINSEFEVLEKNDKSEVLREEERFGYQSIHYLVKMKPNRICLPEYCQYDQLIAEIQVRTILQHAWAEIEHDIQYKSVEIIPTEIHRRFTTLAGLIEITDREFQAIQDADTELTQKARESVEEGRLDEIEITPDALKAYLDKKLGSDGRMTEWSYEWEARMLRKLGFTNFHQIDECISDFDDDHISKIVWGYRQGQMNRFDDVLLAGMGEEFINRHTWANEKWFVDARKNRLEYFKSLGIQIKNYIPS
jgi:ppGpp synthetase/RelA/SpoT-type nucleotidyltranferase